MTEAARDLNVLPATTTEGLEDFFDVAVAEGQDVARPPMADGQPGGQTVTIVEAAEILGITRRSALRLVQEGKLDGAKDGQGQWLVKTASIQTRLHAKTLTTSQIEPVAVELAEGHGQGWPGGQDQGHQEILKELLAKLEVLTYRNGYLESQLRERENDLSERDQQIKLLTDSQHKPGWWAQFKKWCAGQ